MEIGTKVRRVTEDILIGVGNEVMEVVIG